MQRRGRNVQLYLAIMVAFLAMIAFAGSANAGPLPGAVFTTVVDGTIVNANVQYQAKEDVYLDGGPGMNAPSGAAALPEGDYYFMVTDPSGKVLLSVDPISSRKIHINQYGVIDYVYPALSLTKYKGKWYGTHLTGVDVDWASLGAITVQLMPYQDTPNPGGVYKVWVTPVGHYTPGEGKFGFIPAWSKTDNYKVKGGKPFVPPTITYRKFDDANANGVWDLGEVELFGWQVDVTDPLAVITTIYTKDTILAVPDGVWTSTEETPAGWLQTCVYVDGVAQTVSPTVTVTVAGISGETHEVIYGNIQLAKIVAWKFYDKNCNGIWDPGEPPVAGVLITLTGIDVRGDVVLLSGYTGINGALDFGYQLPGDYTLTETVPSGWLPTTPTSVSFTLKEGEDVAFGFGNVCIGYANFDTKGYWHNKNGLGETTLSDLAYLNSLLPWQAPSSYFGAGDEPINGTFADGTPVAAANGDWGELIAPAGSPWAEQSHFLVDANAGGDPREQLAQQLDAFIMNVIHRLGGDTMIQLPDGTWVLASGLIADAIDIWASGTAQEQNEIAGLLDALNNNDSVVYVCPDPCLTLSRTALRTTREFGPRLSGPRPRISRLR